VEHAQQLMQEHPDWPVTRIAQISGFNDRSWFYQQFLRFTGMTVAECRKK
jgi:AraC-like DNA-binding protein